ncbi:MAG: hypothetical protein FWC27_07895 [Firmicutes bacterium]|nr:hypothetical protein [Bacillota bacterium]
MSPDGGKGAEGTLDPLNIAARYPEQKAKLAAMLTLETCKNILTETEALLCWIKQLL